LDINNIIININRYCAEGITTYYIFSMDYFKIEYK